MQYRALLRKSLKGASQTIQQQSRTANKLVLNMKRFRICGDNKFVFKITLIVCVLVGYSNADELFPGLQSNENAAEISRLLGSSFSVFNRCADKDFTLCLKEKTVQFIDNLPKDYEIMEGVRIYRTPVDDSSKKSFPSLSSDEYRQLSFTERDQTVDNMIADRLSRVLSSYTLQLKVPDSTIGEMNNSMEEGRRKKKRKMLLPLLMLLKFKAATLIPMVLGTLALLSFKALLLGKVALLISGLIALKKLFHQEPNSQTYEVVAHPHHSYSNTYDEHGHYGRSLPVDAAQKMAFKAQVP